MFYAFSQRPKLQVEIYIEPTPNEAKLHETEPSNQSRKYVKMIQAEAV